MVDLKNDIDTCLLKAHSSLINGIDRSKASTYLVQLVKDHIEAIVEDIENLLLVHEIDRQLVEDYLLDLKENYKLYE